MNRSSLLVGVLLGALFLILGCSGDDGAMGPAGSSGTVGGDGTPQPIKVLIAGAEGQSTLEDRMVSCVKEELFPIGTTIDIADITSFVPSLSFFNQYDAVLVYSQQTWNTGTALGDTLADYVDAGGGVVLAQGCFITGSFELFGRIMTAGYTPFDATSTATAQTGDRTIDFSSLTIPLHPVFNGTDVKNFVYEGGSFLSNPALASGATLLAANLNGHNALAINAGGTVIGANIWISGIFSDPVETDARKLLANCLLLVGGGI